MNKILEFKAPQETIKIHNNESLYLEGNHLKTITVLDKNNILYRGIILLVTTEGLYVGIRLKGVFTIVFSKQHIDEESIGIQSLLMNTKIKKVILVNKHCPTKDIPETNRNTIEEFNGESIEDTMEKYI